MKQFRTFLAILFVSLLSSPSWSAGISIGDLVKRDGLTYKKFTDVPFTGDVDEGLEQGNYKNGKQEGPWLWYSYDGTVEKNLTGTYKNGIKISDLTRTYMKCGD